VAKFFADRDIVFTMPDKTSTPVPFMKDIDADFLKRSNVFVPELGMHVGALDELSIFKSLHANLRSKGGDTPAEAASKNIDGALRDWFFHGREIYEKRRSEMCEVARRAEIDHMCHMLEVPFDEQVGVWFARYFPHDPEMESRTREKMNAPDMESQQTIPPSGWFWKKN
jgi:hypothetical protein